MLLLRSTLQSPLSSQLSAGCISKPDCLSVESGGQWWQCLGQQEAGVCKTLIQWCDLGSTPCTCSSGIPPLSPPTCGCQSVSPLLGWWGVMVGWWWGVPSSGLIIIVMWLCYYTMSTCCHLPYILPLWQIFKQGWAELGDCSAFSGISFILINIFQSRVNIFHRENDLTWILTIINLSTQRDNIWPVTRFRPVIKGTEEKYLEIFFSSDQLRLSNSAFKELEH